MIKEESSQKNNVINLQNIRLRRKYKLFFMLINKIKSIFHRKNKPGERSKDAYKRTVNH